MTRPPNLEVTLKGRRKLHLNLLPDLPYLVAANPSHTACFSSIPPPEHNAREAFIAIAHCISTGLYSSRIASAATFEFANDAIHAFRLGPFPFFNAQLLRATLLQDSLDTSFLATMADQPTEKPEAAAPAIESTAPETTADNSKAGEGELATKPAADEQAAKEGPTAQEGACILPSIRPVQQRLADAQTWILAGRVNRASLRVKPPTAPITCHHTCLLTRDFLNRARGN